MTKKSSYGSLPNVAGKLLLAGMAVSIALPATTTLTANLLVAKKQSEAGQVIQQLCLPTDHPSEDHTLEIEFNACQRAVQNSAAVNSGVVS